MQPAPVPIEATYFDGLSARARRVCLTVAAGQLHISGDGVDAHVPLAEVEWPERTRHGTRVTRLRDGASLQALDSAAWDAWQRANGKAESPVVKAQQSWRATALALLLLLALVGAGYQWGVPWAARGLLVLLPQSADRALGDAVWQSMDGQVLTATALPAARQTHLREAFAAAVARTYPGAQPPHYELRFHASPSGSQLGPNAFALPGGTIVVTDALVALLGERDDVLIGVLGHELGHVQHRHGMRMLVQVTLIGTATSLAWGDFSAVLAAAPALLGQMAYSRDFERAADADAITLLRANGISPAVMIELFERLAAARGADGKAAPDKSAPGIAFASHPQDAERVKLFREAAAR
jgi:Zn-dependent protease with chaperone function